MGLLLSGLETEASIFSMAWWSSKGKARMHPSILRENLLYQLAKCLPQDVVHVFDRGYAQRPWLGQLFAHQQSFILRWPNRFLLTDSKGNTKNAWKFSTGKKPMDSTWIQDAPRKTRRQIKMLYLPVTHPDWPEQSLFLVISRQGKGRPPWYLLTNLEISSHQQAWEVIFSYARRWKIEQTFRFAKSEMALESPRLWFWENRLKCMALLSLAMDFLLYLLQQGRTSDIEDLLDQWCPRTGNRCREAATPIYRPRLALSHAWNYLIILNSG